MEKPPLVCLTFSKLVQVTCTTFFDFFNKKKQVKRLTMGLLRAAEDRSPLVHTSSLTSTVPYSQDGYVNEGVICDPERIIATTFGDSCRDTLNQFNTTSNNDEKGATQQYQQNTTNIHTGNNEFEYKRNIFHETHNNNGT